MSILYDEAQTAIAAESARVLKARHAPDQLLKLLEKLGEHDQTFWATCIEQGWTGITIPESHGGLELGLVELGVVAEAAGQVTAGAPFLTTSAGFSHGLGKYGSGELQEKWLPRVASGDIVGVTAFAERQSPVPSAPSVQLKDAKLYGTKTFVTGALGAQAALVLASSSGAPSLVLVDLAGTGVEKRAQPTFDNSRVAGDLVFDGAPATLLVSGEAALEAALDILAVQAVITAYEQVGGAQACLDRARAYALERRAFGQPIAAFQSVKHRIAELYVLIELARANAIHAAAQAGKPGFLLAAAAARLSASEAYDTAARDATQIHGGIGVTWEAALHLHQRRTRTLSIEQGSALFWEDLLADILIAEGSAL